MSKKINVLYIEDEPNIAKLLTSGLGLFGISVHPALISGEHFLEQYNAPEYATADILLFDIRLPKMTGLELARQLRQRGETRPIVLVSAWPSPSRDELNEVHAAFLPKPFDFPDVVETVQRLAWGEND
jgi:CheY-like chemotaxis protein